MSKPLQLKDLTEISNEWILHDEGWKKFVLVINFIHGEPHIKYRVYRNTLCIASMKDKEVAFAKYVALEKQKFIHVAEESEEGEPIEA